MTCTRTEPVLDTPACVTSRDARDLAAAEEVFIARGGFETFADLLAYRFLDRVGGWWVDNDVVCTHGDMPDAEIAFAEERPGILNNAVLRFPASPSHHRVTGLHQAHRSSSRSVGLDGPTRADDRARATRPANVPPADT